MNSFYNLLKISDIRNQQLKREKNIDKNLIEHSDKCSRKIMKYLFRYRHLNRYYSDKLYTSSILKYPEILKDNIEAIDDHFTKIEKFIKTNTLCENIDSIFE